MRLFLDASVLLAGSGSSEGASREIFRRAPINQWSLIATPYVLGEVAANLARLGIGAGETWNQLQTQIRLCDDVWTIPLPSVFSRAKDRPVLFGALDRNDFEQMLGGTFYGVAVLKPGSFLHRERAASRLV